MTLCSMIYTIITTWNIVSKQAAAPLTYTLIRKKMKNIRIRVTGASKVIVSAPHHTSEKQINRFVGDNEIFIFSKLKKPTINAVSIIR